MATKTENVTLKLGKKLKAALVAACEQKEESISEYARKAVEQRIKREKEEV